MHRDRYQQSTWITFNDSSGAIIQMEFHGEVENRTACGGRDGRFNR